MWRETWRSPARRPLSLYSDTHATGGSSSAGAGAPAGAIAACFATDAQVKRVLAVSNATSQVPGTPAFEINGRLIQNVDWAKLEPQLRAAGAK